MASATRYLWRAFDFKLSELLQVDLYVGILGGVASVALAVNSPSVLLGTLGVASQVLGVVVGAVIGGVSIQAAFFDQAFLRKIRAIGKNPVRYLSPFLFTAFLGVVAMLGMLGMASLTTKSAPALLATVGGLTGFVTVWALVSVLPCLGTLVQFINLKMAALDVPDDIGDEMRPRRTTG